VAIVSELVMVGILESTIKSFTAGYNVISLELDAKALLSSFSRRHGLPGIAHEASAGLTRHVTDRKTTANSRRQMLFHLKLLTNVQDKMLNSDIRMI
jgi:hypothetical protein